MNFNIGQKVKFRKKVFGAPYAPYYDAYRGHEFVVTRTPLDIPGHVYVEYTSKEGMPEFMCHVDELKVA